MDKIEYPYDNIITVLKILDSINISGIENIKKINQIIELLDSGILKKNKKEEEK